jgi:carbonic anhydrase
MPKLISIERKDDIPKKYWDTPIEELLEFHNFRKVFEKQDEAKLLISMCMDARKKLRIPENFAFIVRTAGANIRNVEFKMSYTISMLGIRYIALIGHNDCRMVNLLSRKEDFIKGIMKNASWSRKKATEHFDQFAPQFHLEDEKSFILSEQKRLQKLFPHTTIVPMMYNIENNNISLIRE